MARGYWRNKGLPGKTKFIGRIKGYHAVNYGGIGVGGIGFNRKLFGQAVDADHIRIPFCPRTPSARGCLTPVHTWQMSLKSWFCCMMPQILRLLWWSPCRVRPACCLRQGYLKRLREICDAHNLLLIFDEVITGLEEWALYWC